MSFPRFLSSIRGADLNLCFIVALITELKELSSTDWNGPARALTCIYIFNYGEHVVALLDLKAKPMMSQCPILPLRKGKTRR